MPLSFAFSVRHGPSRGTFLHTQDQSPDNQEHWLALIGALQARNLDAIVEYLPRSTGTVVTRTRSGALRKGRLPHRVEAMLAGNAAFEAHQLQRARAYGYRSEDSSEPSVADAPPWVNALDLLQWTAPDLMGPMIRRANARSLAAGERQWAWRRPHAAWIGESGQMVELLAQGGAVGTGPWNPHWPEVVSALAACCLDHLGEDLFRAARERDEGQRPYLQDNALARWLQTYLHQGLTREDVARLDAPRRSVALTGRPAAGATGNGESPTGNVAPAAPVTVWARTLADALEQADQDGWDLPAWQGWARRWMLAAERHHGPGRVVEVAQAFWARWPDERLPVRRSDSLDPATLLGRPEVFTDDRLLDWLVHGEGSIVRPAQRSYTRWGLVERQAGDWGQDSVQPWTWMEWAVETGRLDLARRLASHGWRLYDGFETTYVPHTLEFVPADQAATWTATLETRLARIETVRLTELAYDHAPTPSVRVRPRM